jgi:hypothetical protein
MFRGVRNAQKISKTSTILTLRLELGSLYNHIIYFALYNYDLYTIVLLTLTLCS